LQVTNELQAGELKQIAPKVEFYENVMQSDSLILTTTIAKELGMAAVTLNKMLHSMGIIYKTNDNWILTSRYQNKGYTGTKTYPFADRSGEIKTRINTLWTQKGREFIHKVIKGELVFN
jgi:anti-repressor protein